MKSILLSIALLFSSFTYCQKTILWKISNATNKKVSYLLGTNHLFGKSFVDSFSVLKEKIIASDLVVTETKMDRNAFTAAYNARKASDSINFILSNEDIDYIAELFKRSRLAIAKLSPGELITKLQGYFPKYRCSVLNMKDSLTMDEYIQSIGRKNNKQLYNFETDSFQLNLLTTTLNKYNWDFAKRNVPLILKLYRDKKWDDLGCFAVNQYASFEMDYKFKDTCNFLKGKIMNNDDFIKKRNEAWVLQLPKLLENNNCFIAVGFGHLCNQCGLIKQIEALGYIVEPVTMK